MYKRKLAYAWPVLWLVYTMLRGAFAKPSFTGFGEAPSHYPYGFLDVTRVPLSEVALAVVIISVLLLAIGCAYIYLDQRLAQRKSIVV